MLFHYFKNAVRVLMKIAIADHVEYEHASILQTDR